jgi:membrane fusion protein (multidrug efflux system)
MLFAIPGCHKKEQAAQQNKSADPITVALQPTTLSDVQRTVEVVGTLYGDEEAVISAKVPGRVTQIFKDVGDRISASAPLAQIDKRDYELARNEQEMAVRETLSKLGITTLPEKELDLAKVPTVYRAKLQVDSAKAKLERARQVLGAKNGAISEQEVADLQTTYDVAQSSYDVETMNAQSTLSAARSKQSLLEIADQRLADSTVRAPVTSAATSASTRPAGRYAVAARLVSVGEYVKEGTPLFKLVADDPIKYRATVPERFMADVKTGQQVSVTVYAYSTPFTGAVSRISPQVDFASRSFQIEVVVPNTEGKLQSGSFATGFIQTAIQKQVTFVPIDAVVSFAGVQKVFTVKEGKAVEHPIETGIRQGEQLEVVKGLNGIAQVVTTGANKLAQGAPVTISDQSAPPPAKPDSISKSE